MIVSVSLGGAASVAETGRQASDITSRRLFKDGLVARDPRSRLDTNEIRHKEEDGISLIKKN